MPATAQPRPPRIRLGDVSVFVVRGPHKSDDALWYWRARGPRKAELGARWATEREAETWAAELLLGTRGRAVEEPEPGCELVVDLLGMYLHWYLHERVDVEESTRASAAVVVKRLSRKGYGLRTVRVGRLDRGAVDVYVRGVRKAGQAETTTALDLRVLKAAWAWGRAEGLTPDRVLEVPKLKRAQSRARYTPSAEQVRAVLGQLHGVERTAIAIQAELGARIGEVLSLHLTDLEWPEGWAPVRPAGQAVADGWAWLGRHEGARKSKRARRVPLSGEAFLLLAAQGLSPDATEAAHVDPDADHKVFKGRLAASRRRVAEHLKAAVKACGQRPWTSHALRRAKVRRLIGGGQDPSVAAELLGHSKQIMLEVYDQPSPADLTAAAKASRMSNLIAFPGR